MGRQHVLRCGGKHGARGGRGDLLAMAGAHGGGGLRRSAGRAADRARPGSRPRGRGNEQHAPPFAGPRARRWVGSLAEHRLPEWPRRARDHVARLRPGGSRAGRVPGTGSEALDRAARLHRLQPPHHRAGGAHSGVESGDLRADRPAEPARDREREHLHARAKRLPPFRSARRFRSRPAFPRPERALYQVPVQEHAAPARLAASHPTVGGWQLTRIQCVIEGRLRAPFFCNGGRMAAKAKYVFIASMDVDKDKEALFNEVYDTEHVPMLLKVPGVLSVRRGLQQPLTMFIGGEKKTIVAEGEPRYSAYYELESAEVLTSEAWAKAVEVGRWPSQVRPFTRNRRHVLRKLLK